MKRIGVLVPSGNIAHAREFAALRPDGVAFQFAEFVYPAAGQAFCAELIEAVRGPLTGLGAVDQVLFGCATASVICPEADKTMSEIAAAPVVMAAQASVRALRRLGARSVALATPYGPATNQAISAFLAEHGIETRGVAGLDLDAQAMGRAGLISQDEVLALARAADDDGADAIYLPCTAVGSLGILSRLDKPAMSSILAGFQALDL